MNFEIPSESQIIKGFCQLDCTIYTIEDAVDFLYENISEKKISNRFFSWLVILGILNEKRLLWGKELRGMANKYFNKCNEYFSKKPDYPLRTLSKSSQILIKSDIDSRINWFGLILKESKIGKYIDSPSLRLSRIFTMISIENNEFAYFPNFIHVGCVCLAMTSIFSRDAKLTIDFAESIAFYLTNSLLSVISLIYKKSYNNHFLKIDTLIKIKAPEQSKAIKQNNSSSVYFAVRYEQLLFTCENHSLNDIFNIWDQIFCYLDRIEFVSCLTVSHIMQIHFPPGPQNPNEIISNWKNWDTLKIIEDALEMLQHKRSFIEKICYFFCPSLDYSGYDASEL